MRFPQKKLSFRSILGGLLWLTATRLDLWCQTCVCSGPPDHAPRRPSSYLVGAWRKGEEDQLLHVSCGDACSHLWAGSQYAGRCEVGRVDVSPWTSDSSKRSSRPRNKAFLSFRAMITLTAVTSSTWRVETSRSLKTKIKGCTSSRFGRPG